MTLNKTSNSIVIVGGGSAGITVAAKLKKYIPASEITIIEPSTKHYYQPLWTLVGAGVFPKSSTERDESSVIPSGVTWIQDFVTEFKPQDNFVVTSKGNEINYKYLVVAPGIQIDWHKVKGLKENIGRDGICSNYAYEYVDKTWDFIKNFKSGSAIFTQPNTPIKCGGAPQKIAYLADDAFRRASIRDKSNIIFASANPSIFQVSKYADALSKVIERKGIETKFKHNLVEIRPKSKEAIFQNIDTQEELILHYDLIHVTPPMSSPDFIKQSPLADQAGWVDVDKYTLQHKHYKNIFGIGDASNLPTSKTGAAIRKQAPVLVDNLIALQQGKSLDKSYDGYTSCPLVTGYGSLILAEFDYELKPQETFPFDQSKERYSMYLLKAYGLPILYWQGMLKGRA